MNELNITPVPIAQQPVNEFVELSNLSFFKAPITGKSNLYKLLYVSWLISFFICLTISYGSYNLRENNIELLNVSFLFSFTIPLIILLRLYLGWKYIYDRLNCKVIEYEESDWHDGQVWNKPPQWIDRDYLIAKEEVKPVLTLLKKTSLFIGFFLLLDLLTFIRFI